MVGEEQTAVNALNIAMIMAVLTTCQNLTP
jgi:hypothetical protein